MAAFSALLLDPGVVGGFLQDADGNVRAALICWGIALSAFAILRIPREVLLGCLIAGTVTVGLAATVVEVAPVQATARESAPASPPASYRTATPMRGPATEVIKRERPY